MTNLVPSFIRFVGTREGVKLVGTFWGMRLLRIAVFGVGAALSLTGCGGGSDPAPKSLDEFDANKAACAFSANDGEGAFAPSSSDILTSHFGKRIDINQLKAVLTSSGEETASFVKSLDVRLSRINAS